MKRTVSVGLLVGLFCNACGVRGSFDVPYPSNPQNAQANAADVAPDQMCADVRDRAGNHSGLYIAGGIVIGGLGVATAAVGAGVAAVQGHTPEYVGEWSAVGGLGAIGAAVGVYLLARSASLSQEYWTTNGAIAKIRGDYLQYPYLINADGQAAFQNWLDALKKVQTLDAEIAPDPAAAPAVPAPPPAAAAAAAAPAAAHAPLAPAQLDKPDPRDNHLAKVDYQQDVRELDQRRLKLRDAQQHQDVAIEHEAGSFAELLKNAPGWHAKPVVTEGFITNAINTAERLRIAAQVANADATATAALASLKDTAVTADQTDFQAKAAAQVAAKQKMSAAPQAGDAASKKAREDAATALLEAEDQLELSGLTLGVAQQAATLAHTRAIASARIAAEATATATDALNFIQGLQVAWTDCAAALTAIGGPEAAAATAVSAALTSGKPTP